MTANWREKVQKFAHKVFQMIKKPEMRILPGQLAFFLLVSIIPLFAIIAVVAGRYPGSWKPGNHLPNRGRCWDRWDSNEPGNGGYLQSENHPFYHGLYLPGAVFVHR